MCSDYEQQITWAQYQVTMKAVGLSLSDGHAELDLPRMDDVWIDSRAPVVRSGGSGIELKQMRFSFTGRQTDKTPIFNIRSEGHSFNPIQRCIIPASAFFEFTGARHPKSKHRFSLANARFLGVAGIWREETGRRLAFAMLTTRPGADIKPYHNRQIVVLPPQDWAAWLYATKPETDVLRPLPVGSLMVQPVREGQSA